MLNRKTIVGIGAGVLVLGIAGCAWYNVYFDKKTQEVQVTPTPTVTNGVNVQIGNSDDDKNKYSFSEGSTGIKKSKYGDDVTFGQIVEGDYISYNEILEAMKNEYGKNFENLEFPKFTDLPDVSSMSESPEKVTITDDNIKYLLEKTNTKENTIFKFDTCVVVGTSEDKKTLIAVPKFGSTNFIILKNGSGNTFSNEQGFQFSQGLYNCNINTSKFGNFNIIIAYDDDVMEQRGE